MTDAKSFGQASGRKGASRRPAKAPGRGGRPAEATLHTLGERLRRLRQRRQVSQSELARRTGVPRTYVISLEQGGHEPSLRLLARMACGLGYSLQEYVWELAGEGFADPAAPLGARLQLRRERFAVTQAALARRTGLPRATVSQLETGLNRNPGLFLLVRVADKLGCCPSELAHGLEAALLGDRVQQPSAPR